MKPKLVTLFTPKTVILDAIRSKLEPTGINKFILVFLLESNTYNVMLKNDSGESFSLDIEKEDISLLKKMFIAKIVRQWNKKYNNEPKSVIIQVDLKENALDVFIVDKKDKTLKFEY